MDNYIYQDNLSSPRLSTQFLDPGDMTDWAAFFEDASSVRFLPDYGPADPFSKSENWVKTQMERYSEKRFGLQKIIEKGSGRFVGQCGLLLQEVNGQPEIEVGYHILKAYRGKGFAPEAARIFIDFAFRHQLSSSIISIIHADNTASKRVAEKNGLKVSERMIWAGFDVCIYRVYRDEWN